MSVDISCVCLDASHHYLVVVEAPGFPPVAVMAECAYDEAMEALSSLRLYAARNWEGATVSLRPALDFRRQVQ